MSQIESEPGWAAGDEPSQPTTTPAPPVKRNRRPKAPPAPNQNQVSNGNQPPTTATTEPEFFPTGRRPKHEAPNPNASKVLTEIVASVFSGLSSLASFYTNRAYGFSAKITEAEAKTIAAPIAQIIQRRTHIRNDLNDAADGAGAIAGVLNYLERVAAEKDTPRPRHAAPDFESPAPAPRPAPTVAPTAERVDSFVDQSRGKNEPTSGGAFKETFLSGFEEIHG
jgi:hypothetical protein